jgi:D-alanine transaminase
MNPQIAFLNGEFVELSNAKISVLDRGFIFGDGVYEVIPVYSKRLFRLDEHLERLQNSLDAIRIDNPYPESEWKKFLSQIVMKHAEEDQSIYLQVTRGVAPRDHAFPKGVKPTVFMMSTPLKVTDQATFEKGIAAITLDDIRWLHCNVKAIALLPNILMRQTAIDEGAQEAILVRDGEVTEGAASNVFIVRNGVIKTPPKSARLLPGVTRDLVVELAKKQGLLCEESNFSRPELQAADEIWMTSSTKEILPVVKLNDAIIGNGKPGKLTRQMYEIYQQYKQQLRLADD